MNFVVDIDGLHLDGKLVMIWADPSDLVARDKLIAEFEAPDLPEEEEQDESIDRILELEDKVGDLERELYFLKERMKKCKNLTELK